MNDGLSTHTSRSPCILCSYTQRPAIPQLLCPLPVGKRLLFSSVRSLPLRHGIMHRETNRGMQAWQWGEMLPFFVFPEVILVRGQHHGLQLLAKSPNSAHHLPARGKASTRCSTLQSLSNSDFLSSLFFSLGISRKCFFC